MKRFPLLICAALLVASRVLAVPAGDEYIPAREFAATAVREIDAARTSVRLFLYLFSYRDSAQDAGPGLLARALARAKGRGVRVEVTLNGSFDPAEPDGGTLNGQAAEFLRAGGVDTYFSSGALLHAKVLVVDERVVLFGSSNWSASAFSKNFEGNGIFRSTEAARAALEDFAGMTRTPAPGPDPAAVPVPAALAEPGGALGTLLNRQDGAAFDAYMILLQWKMERSTGTLTVDRPALARALGLPEGDPDHDTREIRLILDRLEKKYELAETLNSYKDPIVRLREVPGRVLPLPSGYFKWGWGRRLSMPGKALYLIGLDEAAASPLSPRWSASEAVLARRHGIHGRSALGRGVEELRRAGLLEVEYRWLEDDGERRPNVYRNRPFYDPAELEAAFQALEKTHGPEAVARGRSIAALVYDDADVHAVERFIVYERKYGKAAMDRALEIVGGMKPDNPRRSVGYLLGILDGNERENRTDP